MSETAAFAGALIWCPFPDEPAARACAGQLLDEQLVACANLLAEHRALYVWQGQRAEAEETGVLFKTRTDLLERTVARLEALHPYETPAILAWPCSTAGATTLTWLGSLKP